MLRSIGLPSFFDTSSGLLLVCSDHKGQNSWNTWEQTQNLSGLHKDLPVKYLTHCLHKSITLITLRKEPGGAVLPSHIRWKKKTAEDLAEVYRCEALCPSPSSQAAGIGKWWAEGICEPCRGSAASQPWIHLILAVKFYLLHDCTGRLLSANSVMFKPAPGMRSQEIWVEVAERLLLRSKVSFSRGAERAVTLMQDAICFFLL